jgi:hypothetical protein
MTEYLTTYRGDTLGYDCRGEGPGVVFVAGAGPFRAIDPRTTQTAEILAERGFRTVVHDRVGRADSFRVGRVDLDDEVAAVRAMVDVAPPRPTEALENCAVAPETLEYNYRMPASPFWTTSSR